MRKARRAGFSVRLVPYSANVSKMIRLTLLAPDIVELILKGGEPIKIDLLKQPFSIEWSAQRDALIAANVKDSREVR